MFKDSIPVLVLPCPLSEKEKDRILKYVNRVLNERFKEKLNGKNKCNSRRKD